MLGPIIGWNLTGSPSQARQLTIDGLSVLRKVGDPGGYGVPIGSVQLTEAAPGQVSSLSFRIGDPKRELTIVPGQVIRFDDIAHSLPLFYGFVDSFSKVALGGAGVAWDVTCVGIEKVLDWQYVPAMTIASGTPYVTALQSIYAAATGISVPLNVTNAGLSTQANPVGIGNQVSTQAIAIPAGTLRSAIQALATALVNTVAGGAWPTVVDYPASVDFYGGLRIAALQTQWLINDYAILQVGTGFARAPSNTDHRTDAGSTTRGVWVIGGNAAGTGLVMDGTGLPGQIAELSDPNSLDATYMVAAALRFLSSNGVSLAGQVTLEEDTTAGAAGAEIRAGGELRINDLTLQLTNYITRISQIDKTFEPTTETWVVSYGSVISAAQFIRRLTRRSLTN